MIERLTDPGAGNWVDRGEEPESVLRRLLEFYLPRGVIQGSRLDEHVTAIRGMVEADSTEYQVGGYVALIEREAEMNDPDSAARRTLGIALWHTAKCAEVRERARRLMDFGVRSG